MNEYRILFTTEGREDTESAYITERTEAAARKAFGKRFGKEAEIAEIELAGTDVNATKDQERETLEKIKAMVAELGPDSYLKTAFGGVFEIAEMNIDEDAAYSFPGRVNLLEEQLREMGSKYNAAKLDAAHMEAEHDAALTQLAAAQKQIAALQRRQLPEPLRRDLRVFVTDEAEASRTRMAKAADKMAISADNPGCVLFKDSVADYRMEKERAVTLEKYAAALDDLEPKEE